MTPTKSSAKMMFATAVSKVGSLDGLDLWLQTSKQASRHLLRQHAGRSRHRCEELQSMAPRRIVSGSAPRRATPSPPTTFGTCIGWSGAASFVCIAKRGFLLSRRGHERIWPLSQRAQDRTGDGERGGRAVDAICPPQPPRPSSLPSASSILRRGSSRRMRSTARPNTEHAWGLRSFIVPPPAASGLSLDARNS